MHLNFPVWPAVEFERPPELMTVAGIEDFASSINGDLDLPDDMTLDEASAIPGGLAVFCRRQRQRERSMT